MNISKLIRKKDNSVLAFSQVSEPVLKRQLAGDVMIFCSGTYKKVSDVVSEIKLKAVTDSKGNQRLFEVVFFDHANQILESLPNGLERSALITWIENDGKELINFPIVKKPLAKTVFDNFAKIAAHENRLLRRGEGWLIMLEGSVMMSCDLEDGDYRYYQHF